MIQTIKDKTTSVPKITIKINTANSAFNGWGSLVPLLNNTVDGDNKHQITLETIHPINDNTKKRNSVTKAGTNLTE